jgi:FeS assembly SUF system protein
MDIQLPAAAGAQVALQPDEQLREALIAALRTVYDPESPVNIYDLGLIYALNIADRGRVAIDMTLTAPGCPVAGTFPAEVESRLMDVPGVSEVHVTLVWEPPWSMELIPEHAKLQLGLL